MHMNEVDFCSFSFHFENSFGLYDMRKYAVLSFWLVGAFVFFWLSWYLFLFKAAGDACIR